jgi:DNA mismatch repair protein MLH3
MPSRILPLSEDAISQIISSKQITSLSGVVIALLENALDAGATKINISVNFGRGSCVVEDNGCGIPSTEFFEHGGLGKVHHTSKAASGHALHGSTGTYLASLAALSMLSITSRFLAQDLSATMIMHQGRVVTRNWPSLPANELTVFGTSGTRVSVNDLFGNMPVRVKQRALVAAQGISTGDRVWLDMKRGIAALLLAWKAPCSVKLRDSESHGRNITMSGSHFTVSSALSERNLNTLHGEAVRYDLRDAFPLLFQAGLAPSDSRARWVPVSASTSQMSCHGLICLDPSPTRLCQFVSIGIQPCSSIGGHSVIYETINKLFSNSTFGIVVEHDNTSQARQAQQPSHEDVYTQNRTSKGIDRWPMFVLQLKPKDETEMLSRDQSENQLKQILDILEAVARQWLDVNEHRPQKRRIRKGQKGVTTSSPTQAACRDLDPRYRETLVCSRTSAPTDMHTVESCGKQTGTDICSLKRRRTAYEVDHLSRIKSGRKDAATPLGSSRSSTTVDSVHFTLPPLESDSVSCHFKVTKPRADLPASHVARSTFKLASSLAHQHQSTFSDNFGSVSETDLLKAAASMDATIEDPSGELTNAQVNGIPNHNDTVEWTEPVTKTNFTVKSCTGIVTPLNDRPGTRPGPDIGPRRPAIASAATSATGRPLTLVKRGISAIEGTSTRAVPTFLSNWQNQVFACQPEKGIPIACVMGPGIDTSESDGHFRSHNNVSNYFAASGAGTQSKLTKSSLQHARVVNQVDAKFILCSLPATDHAAQTLVLVDQHAVSERVILESLLSNLCAPIDRRSPAASLHTNLDCVPAVDTVLLDRPLIFEVMAEESNLFRANAPSFARFGILYDLHTKTEGKVHYSLSARALPSAISERCKLFPKLLIDLLRSEIWSRVDAGRAPTTAQPHLPSVDQGWLGRIGSCPKALLEMINSRACRSAIMFNDVLSILECEELMRQLAKCVFPFMCAHGRVSMAPIALIGSDGQIVFDEQSGKPAMGKKAGDGGLFSKAFQEWRAKPLI